MITRFNPLLNVLVSFVVLFAAILFGTFVRSLILSAVFVPNMLLVATMAALGTVASFAGRAIKGSRA